MRQGDRLREADEGVDIEAEAVRKAGNEAHRQMGEQENSSQ